MLRQSHIIGYRHYVVLLINTNEEAFYYYYFFKFINLLECSFMALKW